MKQLLKSEYVIFIQKQNSYQWGVQRVAEDVPPPQWRSYTGGQAGDSPLAPSWH